ncbi:bifunctional phosphoribosylaminoimidazolecarboxamide formyltransferase/IMP cyclohydrolase [Buchnera aphidicola]|uniref:Bifunctional purine biosynthesis protein PurH n=1 Tax=Buchnera aphidicola (Therioaphis trifolii) TaxID=1241884 RepID=A0A4D6YAM4_9GAMM|nr:bifunctional phosphoribosylaminoimidazolecarboxamide formyltransferase/IMP cyclohydrolase [Buchnera aphidicola]QCI27036.1 bifunctional phosphoribosylaminoimidazolecarboxamide formyltransferase/IMP cyclohydrolase PurH [Buchnera aphidicola (Therioaphis trifolii)]
MELKKQIIKNALISVSNKKNIITFTKQLLKKKIKIFTTKNTKNFLKNNNIITNNISKITEYPEILNGKIKTLHPKIFGGILGNRGNDDLKYIKKYNITIIDLVVVNFYPFNTSEKNINIKKNIDIGGPALVRAAAKNYKNTIILVDVLDYDKILLEINNTKGVSIETRLKLAKKAFEYTSNYDYLIFKYFNKKIYNKKNINSKLPNKIYIKYYKKQNLKYGENPNQKAALYVKENKNDKFINSFEQLNGKKLSYNNFYDSHIAYECVNQFSNPSCVIIKHGNPCGASSSNDLVSAYLNAYNSDSISAFGGIIGFNKIITEKLIIKIIKKQFVELIIGPKITKEALNYIKTNNKIKLIICKNYNNNYSKIEFKNVNHYLLVQEKNLQNDQFKNWEVVTKKKPTELEIQYSLFCWKIAKFVKSNAIVYSNKFNIISIGSGQTNRVESVKIANLKYKNNKKKLKLKNQDIIMASDAFFPFRDSIDECIKNNHNISCIIQPGGSIRDKEVIKAADEYNICMIFTKNRIFKH